MKAKNYILFAAALILAACSNDELPTDDPNAPVEIRLTGGLEVQTRTSHDLDTQLKNGEQVHVWVDDAKNMQTTVTTENLYQDKVLTADGNDALTVKDGEEMYFPQTGNAVNIYAIHGNFGEATDWSDGGFWGENITHKVEQNQKTDRQRILRWSVFIGYRALLPQGPVIPPDFPTGFAECSHRAFPAGPGSSPPAGRPAPRTPSACPGS